jgi:hypothetical protein
MHLSQHTCRARVTVLKDRAAHGIARSARKGAKTSAEYQSTGELRPETKSISDDGSNVGDPRQTTKTVGVDEVRTAILTVITTYSLGSTIDLENFLCTLSIRFRKENLL